MSVYNKTLILAIEFSVSKTFTVIHDYWIRMNKYSFVKDCTQKEQFLAD